MIMGINDYVTTIKQAIAVAESLKNVELKDLLLKAKEEALDAKGEVLALTEENQKLTKKLKQTTDFKLDHSLWWKNDDTEQLQPYCPACFAKDLIVPMKPDTPNTHNTYFRCPSCSNWSDPFGSAERSSGSSSAGYSPGNIFSIGDDY